LGLQWHPTALEQPHRSNITDHAHSAERFGNVPGATDHSAATLRPEHPDELEQRAVAMLVGALTLEIDIDELHVRAAYRSGLDLVAPLPPLPG